MTETTYGMLGRLPPEIRNEIYTLVLEGPDTYFIIPAQQSARKFRLYDRTPLPQHQALRNLLAFRVLGRGAWQEARTLFYAMNKFILLVHNFEYLPVFVRWLDAIGSECRAVLRSVCMVGSMWYRPSKTLTRKLHNLLSSCTNIRQTTLHVNIRHVFEGNLEELEAYFSYTSPRPHDGPLPQVDVSSWVSTILTMSNLRRFRLVLAMSLDVGRVQAGTEQSFHDFSWERGRLLANDIETRLKVALYEEERISELSVVNIRYIGGDERCYEGLPWVGEDLVDLE